MSVAEPLAYEFATWAVVEQAGAVKRVENSRITHGGETLDLSVDDFPLRFVTVEATEALLNLAAIAGVCRGDGKEGPFERRFELTPDRPAVGIGVPSEAALAPLQVEARGRGGSKVLLLTVEAAQSAQLDLTSSVSSGRIGSKSNAILARAPLFWRWTLLPKAARNRWARCKPLPLHRLRQARSGDIFASSPFCAGYRYRIHASAGDSPPPWSEVQPPGAPLRLKIWRGIMGGITTRPAMKGTVLDLTGSFREKGSANLARS